ncbi:MAG TPA: hypothetical protein IGS17_05850 [Oscillatoriales cyanobacterium M59_W2019_021]|nr:hypothetical protein [Oscillatoriales cyanobacterium M4454_W2019_049]HIK50436.1 hypothetical protein [Oscillatoriales cyanobacterium M59_W2019_021]
MNRTTAIVCGVVAASTIGCTQTPTPDLPATESSNPQPQTIVLTQVGCQLIETEAKNYQYRPTQAEDCRRINAETISTRQRSFKPLELPAGDYIFQVTNRDVPYEVGFYLRGTGVGFATLPKVSGGGLTPGTTKEYRVMLAPGQYAVSCPLNPTPDYPLVVR